MSNSQKSLVNYTTSVDDSDSDSDANNEPIFKRWRLSSPSTNLSSRAISGQTFTMNDFDEEDEDQSVANTSINNNNTNNLQIDQLPAATELTKPELDKDEKMIVDKLNSFNSMIHIFNIVAHLSDSVKAEFKTNIDFPILELKRQTSALKRKLAREANKNEKIKEKEIERQRLVNTQVERNKRYEQQSKQKEDLHYQIMHKLMTSSLFEKSDNPADKIPFSLLIAIAEYEMKPFINFHLAADFVKALKASGDLYFLKFFRWNLAKDRLAPMHSNKTYIYEGKVGFQGRLKATTLDKLLTLADIQSLKNPLGLKLVKS